MDIYSQLESTALATPIENGFKSWAILELLGHRQKIGFVSEVEIAGTRYLKLESYDQKGNAVELQYYSNASIYCITPIPKEKAPILSSHRCFPWEETLRLGSGFEDFEPIEGGEEVN